MSSCLYIRNDFISLNQAIPANSVRIGSFSHGYLGAQNNNSTTTMVFGVRYQVILPNSLKQYGVDLSVSYVGSSTYSVKAYFPFSLLFFYKMNFYTLFYNATALHQNSIASISQIKNFGPYTTMSPASMAYTTIYTSTSVCGIYSNNTLLGLQSFRGQGSIGF